MRFDSLLTYQFFLNKTTKSKIMKVFVLITAVIELLAGVIMFFAPHLIPDFANADTLSITLARMYGGAAIGLGLFALEVWRHMRSQVMQQAFLRSFLIFHFGVSAAAYFGYSNGVFKDPSTCILHLILALVTAYFLFAKRKAIADNG